MAKKVHRLTRSLLQEGHIDNMTAKLLSLTPDPPQIPVFYKRVKVVGIKKSRGYKKNPPSKKINRNMI